MLRSPSWGYIALSIAACHGGGTKPAESEPAKRPPIAAVDVSLQRDYGCIREPAGTVKCWGVNQSGEVGDGTEIPNTPSENVRKQPTLVKGTVGPGPLHTSSLFTYVVHPDGTATAWGSRMGPPVWKHLEPSPWELPHKVRDVVVGSTFVCGLTLEGFVTCDGVIDGFAPIRADQIVALYSDVCALAGGEVTCWGRSWGTDLGEIDDLTPPPAPPSGGAAPHEVGHAHKYDRKQVKLALPPITKLVAGEREICGIDKAGAAWCWNDEAGRPLNPTPVRLSVCGDAPLQDLALGGETCGQTRDGNVCCIDKYGVIDTTRLKGATELAIGGWYVCGIVANELRCAARGGGDETKLYNN